MRKKNRHKQLSGMKLLAKSGVVGIKRYIFKNWIWIAIGVICTEAFVKVAYAKRGYMAYGGEWLTLPLILMVVEATRNVGDTVRYLFEMKDDYESDRE